jgi:Tripartite tricarboxylate transporter TctB family
MDQRNIISSIFFLLLAVFVTIRSLGLGIGQLLNPRPGFLPFWSSLFLIIFCLILFWINYFNKDEKTHLANLWRNLNWRKNIIVVSALIIYCLALSKIGYLVATFALMAVLFSLSGMKTWAVIISSLLSVILSYGLFHYLLKTPLPRAIWAF